MSKPEQETNNRTGFSRRFLACTQSTGRVGKSTVAEGLITWMHYAGVDFAAVDADTQHQTLARRYPQDTAVFDATKTFDDFARMIRELPAFPVVTIDFPAQATGFLLSAARHFKLLEFFEGLGIRPTLLILAADDSTAKESAASTVRFFQDNADYLLIENPARFKSEEFKKTALNKWFTERSTPTLRIPAVTSLTINSWEALERKLKRYLSLDEARQEKQLHELCRHELGFLRDRFLSQFEDYAAQVLPDINLIRNKIARAPQLAIESQDPLSDPFLITA